MGEQTQVEFRRPPAPGSIRPTIYMEKILEMVRNQGPCSKRELRELGKSQTVDWAIKILAEESAIKKTVNGYILSNPDGNPT